MSENQNSEYIRFNWESLEVVTEGKSGLDSQSFVGQFGPNTSLEDFLTGYGFDLSDPIQTAELFGHFHEALQFIKRYFLKDGNSEKGLDLSIPQELFQIIDISELFRISTIGMIDPSKKELSMWAGIVLKVMHTIVHVDKDLRQNYVSTIQMQIFDRIYRYINRDDEDRLFLQAKGEKAIELADFQTKSKKSRDSIIIKLLHKKENVAEQLFDRIGVRFITYTKFDCMRVIKFLCDHNIIMVHNIKPSRSHNSLIDFHQFKSKYKDYLESIKEAQIDQKEFYQQAEKICNECLVEDTQNIENKHSFTDYRAIHFTARQLIRYVNPFMNEFRKLREEAKSLENLPIAQKILKLDTSSVSNMIRFFYPFEVQITDKESHFKNTEGEASHTEYKKSQLESAKNRLFSVLLKNRKS